jgi:hypothetical protein
VPSVKVPRRMDLRNEWDGNVGKSALWPDCGMNSDFHRWSRFGEEIWGQH